jgi:hypothetical protein
MSARDTANFDNAARFVCNLSRTSQVQMFNVQCPTPTLDSTAMAHNEAQLGHFISHLASAHCACLSILFCYQSTKKPLLDIFSILITSTVSSHTAVRRPTEKSPPIHDIIWSDMQLRTRARDGDNLGSLVEFKLAEVGTVYHKGPTAMYLGKALGRLGWRCQN